MNKHSELAHSLVAKPQTKLDAALEQSQTEDDLYASLDRMLENVRKAAMQPQSPLEQAEAAIAKLSDAELEMLISKLTKPQSTNE
jgi:hypothetical protein